MGKNGQRNTFFFQNICNDIAFKQTNKFENVSEAIYFPIFTIGNMTFQSANTLPPIASYSSSLEFNISMGKNWLFLLFSVDQQSVPFKIYKVNDALTNPQFVRTASIMPAVKIAQFNEPLSLGTLMNLLTSGSFSII